MKKILITGANSYVGSSLENWLGSYPNRYSIDSISLRKDSWKKKDFTGYEVVFHVAGIAHVKETRENAAHYYRVNRDLAYEVAKKAKSDSVRQFIFISSMSVYGIESGLIGKSTPLKPKSNYGKSKLQAEELITALEDGVFKVAVIRPPMIYGKECKGNYQRLANIALKLPLFPNIDNRRSMIYIENLCEFIRLLIDDNSNGLFCPQNSEYVCTSEMVNLINEIHGKNIRMTKLFNPLIRLMRISTVNKVFADLVYHNNISSYKDDYCLSDFKTSILLTERGRVNE
jgi:nucleoside-diphosphate-sugar epimerase